MICELCGRLASKKLLRPAIVYLCEPCAMEIMKGATLTRHTCKEATDTSCALGGADMILYRDDKFWTLEIENKDGSDATIWIRHCPYCGIYLPTLRDSEELWIEFQKKQHYSPFY